MLYNRINKVNWTPDSIFEKITRTECKYSEDLYYKDYIILITGKAGRTGKTCLCKALKEEGFNAIELAEEFNMIELVDFKDNDNHIFEDISSKVVLVILNKRIESVNYNENNI